MADEGSKLIAQHLAALKAIKGRQVSAGWFSSDRYQPTKAGEAGMPVAAIARLMNYGGTIDHPGGTKYIRDAATPEGFLGTRFVKNDFSGAHEVTKPHQIVIPARPFMKLAWENFSAIRSKLQKSIAKKLMEGKISPEQALGQIGNALEGCIAKSIRDGNWAPNARSTVRRKGFDKPLIDSSHMLQTLNSIVS